MDRLVCGPMVIDGKNACETSGRGRSPGFPESPAASLSQVGLTQRREDPCPHGAGDRRQACACAEARRSRLGAVIAIYAARADDNTRCVIAAAGAAGALGPRHSGARVTVACLWRSVCSPPGSTRSTTSTTPRRSPPPSQALPPGRGRTRPPVRDGSRPVAAAAPGFCCAPRSGRSRARRSRVCRAHAVVHARLAASDRVRHLRGGGWVRAGASPAASRRRHLPRWFLLFVTSSAVLWPRPSVYAELLRQTPGPPIGEDGARRLQPGARADHRRRDFRGPARLLHVGVHCPRGESRGDRDNPPLRHLPAPLRRARPPWSRGGARGRTRCPTGRCSSRGWRGWCCSRWKSMQPADTAFVRSRAIALTHSVITGWAGPRCERHDRPPEGVGELRLALRSAAHV